MEKEYIVGKAVENALPDKYVSGVKGDKEGVYRTGDVNLTPANIGAEPEITKNTAFNKDFGTAEGTVCEGNDSRLNNLLPDENGAVNVGGRSSGSTVGKNSVGIGSDVYATGDYSTAIGRVARAEALGTVAIGRGSYADSLSAGSVCIGEYAKSYTGYNVVIGSSSIARGSRGVAIGEQSETGHSNAVAIGYMAKAKGANASVQIGKGTNEASNTLQYLSKRIIDSSGNLYQNNVKLQKLYEPLLDVDKLVPSVENGWTQGSLSTNLQGFEKGEYYVFCTEYAIDGSSTILSSSTSILVTGKAFESFDFSLSSGSGGTLHIFGTSGLTAYLYDWVSNSRKKVASATLWFKKK